MLRVSLIMTCYNCIDQFRRSMESALSQDYPNLELVVVDGGSTDGTVDVIREYAARLQSDAKQVQPQVSSSASTQDTSTTNATIPERTMRWISEPDHGIYDAMNKGIHMATGDVIAVFNDLYTRSDAVSTLIHELEETNADGVHADLVYMDGDTCKRWWRMGDGGIKIRSLTQLATGSGQGNPQQATDSEQGDSQQATDSDQGNPQRVTYPGIHTGWMPAHPTMYLRRSVYERYGDYDTAMRSSSDYDYILRILAGEDAIRMAYVPETMISMFYGGTSNNGLSGYTRNIKEAYTALIHNHVTFPLTAILCRTIRTLGQYRTAGEYHP